MDQLLAKIKELQPVYQTADEQVQKARLAYLQSLESSYTQLQALNAAEHELLLNVVTQTQQVEQRLRAAQQELTRLQPIPEERTPRPDNVASSD